MTRDDTPAPANREEALARLGVARIPPEIVDVARQLKAHGHAAVVVGGAVRDALLGLPAEDWDLATSATPDEVQSIFARTLPTGIDHGTVTVLVRPASGKGKAEPVEVTTFRGEGAYEDGRRPSHVVFLRELEDDLARRDFTVNAFAWDPIEQVFTDPFDGLGDLRRKVVRAVGSPEARFAEDGLRTIRALRFCATRGFYLDPATEAAIPTALDVFDQVSRERVWTELGKLLTAVVPSLGLRPMKRTGMWDRLMLEIDDDAFEAAVSAVDRLPRDAVLRLARLLLRPAGDDLTREDRARRRFEALKPSRHDRQRMEALLGGAARALAETTDAVTLRATAAALDRTHVDDVIRLYEVEPARETSIRAAIDGVPLSTRELVVGGRDLLTLGLVEPGPQLGAILHELLTAVWRDPRRNDRAWLLAEARRLVDERSA